MIHALNITPSYQPDGAISGPFIPDDALVFVLQPRLLGLGCDRIIGGVSGPSYKVIDLSLLDDPVAIDWSGPDSGSITDGADSIVFQGVDQIILPECMKPCAQIGTVA